MTDLHAELDRFQTISRAMTLIEEAAGLLDGIAPEIAGRLDAIDFDLLKMTQEDQ